MNYDPKQYALVFNGLLIQGFASGTFISISKDTAPFSDIVGAYGEVTRVRSHDRRATVTITLTQASRSNEDLSVALNADQRAVNGAGVGAFSLVDTLGRTIVSASQAWVQKAPDLSLSTELENREWEIRLADVEYFVAGIDP